METVYKIGLTCFNCGKKREEIVSRLPMFAFELVQIATECGMYGAFDFVHNRSLVFCNKECADKQKTKKGTYRLRPKQ